MKTGRRGLLACGAALLALPLLAAPGAPQPPADAFREAHAAKAAEIMEKKGAHAPAAQGQCSTCHASVAEPKKLKAEPVALCLECHENVKKAAKKKNVHKPMEDCGNCHDPHAADQGALLTETLNGLCSTCHDPEDGELKAKHFGMVPRRSDCTACHDPHGSDEEHLFLDGGTHDPFPDCKECHLKSGPEGQAKLKPVAETCLGCHDGLGAQLKKTKFVHKPVAKGECSECHWPHVSAQPGLLLHKGVNATCLRCHKQVPKEGHPVVFHKTEIAGKPNPLDSSKPFNCVSCHEPHASQHEALRSADKKTFCLVCHEK